MIPTINYSNFRIIFVFITKRTKSWGFWRWASRTTFHSWRSHCKDIWLFVESKWTLGYLFRLWRQHNAGAYLLSSMMIHHYCFFMSQYSEFSKITFVRVIYVWFITSRFGKWRKTFTTMKMLTHPVGVLEQALEELALPAPQRKCLKIKMINADSKIPITFCCARLYCK